MDASSSNTKISKRKFVPRAPPRPRRPINRPPTTEADGEEQTARVIASNYAIGRGKLKAEKKASAEVVFQPTAKSPAVSLSVDIPEDNGSKCRNSEKKLSSSNVLPSGSSATSEKNRAETLNLVNGDDAFVPKAEKDYVEPWDYKCSYGPTCLPWRQPPSGDPELRNKEEFGEVARYSDYDESAINSAKELGLTPEERGNKKMFFFQLPGRLPVTKQSRDAKNEDDPYEHNPLLGLTGGYMGKMCIYKSGAVKLKLGDILYDVSPGPNTAFSNNIAAINTSEGICCVVGSVEKTVTVTPDIDSLLNSEAEPNKLV